MRIAAGSAPNKIADLSGAGFIALLASPVRLLQQAMGLQKSSLQIVVRIMLVRHMQTYELHVMSCFCQNCMQGVFRMQSAAMEHQSIETQANIRLCLQSEVCMQYAACINGPAHLEQINIVSGMIRHKT